LTLAAERDLRDAIEPYPVNILEKQADCINISPKICHLDRPTGDAPALTLMTSTASALAMSNKPRNLKTALTP